MGLLVTFGGPSYFGNIWGGLIPGILIFGGYILYVRRTGLMPIQRAKRQKTRQLVLAPYRDLINGWIDDRRLRRNCALAVEIEDNILALAERGYEGTSTHDAIFGFALILTDTRGRPYALTDTYLQIIVDWVRMRLHFGVHAAIGYKAELRRLVDNWEEKGT